MKNTRRVKMRYSHVVTTLRVLSNLREGQKLTTRNGIITIDKRANGFFRWFNGDNRRSTLLCVDAVVNEAITLGLTKDLKECVDGLKSLKVTYIDDESTVAHVDLILDKINDS
jgi:hypothetical protein